MNVSNQPQVKNLEHIEFQHVHDHSVVCILAIDHSGKIIYANPAMLSHFNFEYNNIINLTLSVLLTDPSDKDSNTIDFLKLQSVTDKDFCLTTGLGQEKSILLSSSAYTDHHNITYNYLFIKDITPFKKKENLLYYLNTAAEELSKTRDTQSALKKISELIVPRFANWFTIDLVKDNHFELLLLAHQDPEMIKWAHEYRKNYPTDINSDQGSAKVYRTGEPSFFPVITEEMILASITDPGQLKAIQMIGLQSVITVAIKNKGIISFISSIPGHHFDEDDLRFAQNLANHIGLALDNVHLNEEAANEIKQRKEVEDKLKITQTQLKSALSSGLVGTWIRDLKKNVLYADENLSRMFGIPYNPAGCDPEIFQRIIHEDDQDMVLQKRFQSLNADNVYEAEYRIKVNGQINWVFVRGKTEIDAETKAELFTGVMMDITRRKDAEVALKESEERYSAAFFNASVGILLSDINGNLINANPAFSNITGYSESDFQHMNFRKITHPDDLEKNELLYKQLFAGEIDNFIFEKRYLHKDGHIIWVRNSTSLVLNGEGRPGYTISITEDITEQKRVQAELKKRRVVPAIV